MKKCTYCGKEYSDDASECVIDAQPLEIVMPRVPAPTSQQRPVPSENTHCFIVRGDERRGPYLPDQIRTMWKNGSITADSAIMWGDLTDPAPIAGLLTEPRFAHSEAPLSSGRNQSATVLGVIMFGGGLIGLIWYWFFFDSRVSVPKERLSGQVSIEQEASATQQSPITILNVYFLGNRQSTTDWYRITELENTGKTGITAFQGKWTIKDDLDATVAEQEVRFTSDTHYFPPESPDVKDLNKYANAFPPSLPPQGDKAPHVIAPGEKFVIINKNNSNVHLDFASTKENLANCIYGYAEIMQLAPLENWRVTKKITFELEKCITQ